MNNLSSYCALVDAEIRASDKDLPLQKLPDEVLLRIFRFLEIESLLRCSQVSKRIRKICHDQAVWEKCDIQFVKIPIEFIEKILDNGCKHLNLTYCYLIGNPNLKIPTKMKYSSHYRSVNFRVSF